MQDQVDREIEQFKEEREKFLKEREERKRAERCLEEKWESLLHEIRLMRDEVDAKEKTVRDANRKVEVLGECLTQMAEENQVTSLISLSLFVPLSFSFLLHFMIFILQSLRDEVERLKSHKPHEASSVQV